MIVQKILSCLFVCFLSNINQQSIINIKQSFF
eukprot:UN09713